tara:strand:- start:1973 stop:2335 length:363 start_codon:yes stop_codon:yes gene_type:complete
MGNCVSGLGLGVSVVDLNNKEDVYATLYGVLSVDNDLTENGDYFREDTLDLGYKSEADRIVLESTRGIEINTVELFEESFNEVFEYLTRQDYFGMCEYQIEKLTGSEIMLIYAYGGNYGN